MSLRPRLWQPEVETRSADAQWEVMRAALARWQRSHGQSPPRTPAELAQRPFTTKEDLQRRQAEESGPFERPLRELVRLHASSGTRGRRTLVGYTAADLRLWTGLVARGLAAVGVHEQSVIYSALGHGLFTGGFGFTQAATELGALVVPGGQARSAMHVELLRRIRPDVLFATPSYALHLARAHGPVPPIALGVFGAEPWTEADRSCLAELYGMQAVDTYGLSEVIGPGVAFECGAGEGLHINTDAFWPEVVDAEGRPVPEGELGELVLTAPTKEALPLLRYRTGDRTRLDWTSCACGRRLPRMARVATRIDDMVVVRGVNVRPSQVADLLSGGGWQLEVDRGPTGLDELTVVVETAVSDATVQRLENVLGLRISVRVEPSMVHSGGKARRVLDRRSSEGP